MTTENQVTSPLRDSVAQLQASPDSQVVIIGGGINGLATFRDLALQGVNVTLLERNDFCSGASAASSHMIHGGIRYLENGEFRLVKESVTERNGLLRIAPHYVKPLETTVPIFSTFSGILSAPLRFLTHRQGKPTERGALLIKVGLVMYDSFSRDGGSVPRHRFVGRRKSLAALPEMNPGVKYTATYYDASVHDPERLALDVLRDGLEAGDHARAVNYVEAVGSTPDGKIIARDTVTGTEITLSADVIVNASGPWTDLTNGALGTSTTYMGGTKGSHIVLDNDELYTAIGGREIFFEHEDGRIVLLYPFKGKVMVGTTDIEADPAKPTVCTEEEVDYFFDLVHHVFPKITVDREQIVYRFAGIRPLPGHGDTAPGFVSRDYRIVPTELGGTPLLSLVGGKWTTFRALAEHLSTEVTTLLAAPRSVSTAKLAIGGGKGLPTNAAQRTVWIGNHRGSIPAARAEQLLARYGTHAAGVLDYLTEHGDDALTDAPAYSRQEVAYFATTEHVVTLLDVLKRRTSLAFTGSLTYELLTEIAAELAEVLGWTEERTTAQVEAAVAELRAMNSVELTDLTVRS